MNQNFCIFDLETIPNQNLTKFIEQYIAEKWSKKKAGFDQGKERALHPALGQIVCIGGVAVDGDFMFSGPDEKKILIDFWTLINNRKPNRFVGFNSLSFDAPYINARTHILGIPHYRDIPTIKYHSEIHFDVRMSLTNYDKYVLGDLTFWASAFGIEFDPSKIDSSSMLEKYEAGDWPGIENHCRQDVRLTKELFEKIK